VEKDTKSKLESALWLASKGFRVFPLIAGGKTPAIDDFPHKATLKSEKIKKWWVDPVMGYTQDFNIGISTEDLLVVDVDLDKKPRIQSEITWSGGPWIKSISDLVIDIRFT